jgi:hypothetical protein
MKEPNHFVMITREHLQRLAEAAVFTASPRAHLSCDWLIALRKELKPQQIGD